MPIFPLPFPRSDSTFLYRLLFACFVVGFGSNAFAEESTEQLRFFESHVRPLLHSRCVKCHGENQQKGGLRLDSRESVVEGGESGAAIVPGKPEESLLMEAVRYESFEMPPDKPLDSSDVAILEKWIADGATWPSKNGKSLRLAGAAFTKEERGFWSLQPIASIAPPGITNWGFNEIDAFIAEKLRAKKLNPAQRATDDVLLRRLYFDVLGVPPSPQDIAAIRSPLNEHDWSKLVDDLLNDPRYGEHWARHWLDIVRYAESDGFRADFYRPEAWRYRDYVVNAFNNDKPYDQFVTEQLAGDEVGPDKAESLVATGFLRTYLYEYNQRDARTQWQDILNQVTDVTGEVFLGMGVGCARCHDHKFDPILQEDYYRLRACFGTMIPRDDVPAADRIDRDRYAAEHTAWMAKASDLREELQKIRGPYMSKAEAGAIKIFPEDIQVIMAKAPADRTPLDAQLADLVNRQVLFDQNRAKIKEEDQKRIDDLEQQIKELSGKEPARLPTAITVSDVGSQPQVLHLGGDATRKKVAAGGFTIVAPEAFDVQATDNSTGQRTALAKWITSSDNPLTARVIVNRIWQQHFGVGLVDTASDFGSLGGRPSHPKLLDWLASEFMTNGWSIKWLHRKILNSATWQMSSFHPNAGKAESIDPANRLRWRFDIRRLSAEQIRDAMLSASSELKSEQGGPSVEYASLRRSLYMKAMRNTPESLMRSLDGVDGLNSIPRRSTTTTPTQALNLMNGSWVRARSQAMAKRILDEFEGTDPTGLVENAFQISLGRRASADEIAAGVKLLNDAGGFDSTSMIKEVFTPVSDRSGNSATISNTALSPIRTKDDSPSITAPFTFVGIIRLNSLYEDATVRTIISQWNSNNKTAGWAIGITSAKSAFQPRNFILQVVSDTGYKVVASNLRPDLNKTYMLAVAVEQLSSSNKDGNSAQATFYLQAIDKDAELQTATVPFPSAEGIKGSFPIVLGGRNKQKSHQWDGRLDQPALFSRSLEQTTVSKLFSAGLNSAAIENEHPLAFWSFDQPEQPFVDDSGNEHSLEPTAPQQLNPLEKAVAELCHVLLNSNEFVYID